MAHDDARAQPAGAARALQQRLDVLQEGGADEALLRLRRRELAAGIGALADDGMDARHAPVGGDGAQHVDEAALELAERVGGIDRAAPLLLEGKYGACEHGLQQIGLVAEVPVQRAARHAGRGGDVAERRGRDAACAEDGFGGVEQGVARGGGVFLGAAGHAVGPSRGAPAARLHSSVYVY